MLKIAPASLEPCGVPGKCPTQPCKQTRKVRTSGPAPHPCRIIGAYCNSFTKAFVLDDLLWIKGPLNLDDTWSYMRLMIIRPLIGVSILLNYRLGGFNVGGYHVVNLAIHILAALTLFGIIRRTLLLELAGHSLVRLRGWHDHRPMVGGASSHDARRDLRHPALRIDDGSVLPVVALLCAARGVVAPPHPTLSPHGGRGE